MSAMLFLGMIYASTITAENSGFRLQADTPRIFKYQVDLTRILPGGQQVIPPTVWEFVVRDVVAYVYDVPFTELQTTPEVTSSQPRPVIQVMAVGDIREINGNIVRGTYTFRAMPILTTPNPSPQTGISIADSSRIVQVDHAFEIFQEDGTPIGSIFAYGLGLGPPTPGAPIGAAAGSLAVIGGTGPYLAMRGQLNTGPPIDENTPFLRFASDQALVTRKDPAMPGEVLVMLVSSLGPTAPSVDPGEPFPRSPLAIVHSPVDVLVNGELVTPLFARGEPGTVNVYEVEFRIPPTVPRGPVSIQVQAGFVKGPEFQIWIR